MTRAELVQDRFAAACRAYDVAAANVQTAQPLFHAGRIGAAEYCRLKNRLAGALADWEIAHDAMTALSDKERASISLRDAEAAASAQSDLFAQA